MKKNDVPVTDVIDGVRTDDLPFSAPQSIPGFPVYTAVGSVHSDDISGYPKKRRISQRRFTTFKYVLGDVYRLCLAADRKEAVLVFGADDPIRVSVHSTDSQLSFDLFAPHDVLLSDYDGRVILQYPFK